MACALIVGQKTQQWHGCGGRPARAGGTETGGHSARNKKILYWFEERKNTTDNGESICKKCKSWNTKCKIQLWETKMEK